MNLSGMTVVIVGLGKSGCAAARLALACGAARVVANDGAPIGLLGESARALANDPRVELVAGGHGRVPWGSASLAVVSPGVAPAAYSEACRHGVPVVGELEFAWSTLAPVDTIAIGGTNGKSTTTTLVGEMLTATRGDVFVGGNLGTALSEGALAARGARPHAALVLEVSSFQAETMTTFRPRAAAILNVTADHLDRYDSFDDYAAAKERMVGAMAAPDVLVVPNGDPICGAMARRSRALVVTFGPGGDVDVTPSAIVDRARGMTFARAEMRLEGEHNAMNAAAALALAAAAGAGEGAMRSALASFAGLPHRIACVGEAGGVRYYDDSKGTNVGAAVAALRGLREPRAVLIAGGRDKGGAYEPLVAALAERGRALVVIGEAAERIADAASGTVTVARAATIDEAVAAANELARPGDAVLLSPACSSFDMFRDYRERGDAFASAVRALTGARGRGPGGDGTPAGEGEGRGAGRPPEGSRARGHAAGPPSVARVGVGGAA